MGAFVIFIVWIFLEAASNKKNKFVHKKTLKIIKNIK